MATETTTKTKFQVGDWIISKKYPDIAGKITSVLDEGFWYEYVEASGNPCKAFVRAEDFDRYESFYPAGTTFDNICIKNEGRSALFGPTKDIVVYCHVADSVYIGRRSSDNKLVVFYQQVLENLDQLEKLEKITATAFHLIRFFKKNASHKHTS